MQLPAFDKQLFEEWFVRNVDTIYQSTGIAHYNAQSVGLVKLLFLQQLQIDQLQRELMSLAEKTKTD